MNNFGTDYLFVYGTLLNTSRLSITRFLNSNSTPICSGYFPGKLYEISDYPGAVYIPENSSFVHGNILKLQNTELVLKELDLYEEVGNQFSTPNEYLRTVIRVQNTIGQDFQCWAYLYNLQTENLQIISSGKYKK